MNQSPAKPEPEPHAAETNSTSLPTAHVVSRPAVSARAVWFGSHFWWLAVGALLISILLVGWTLPGQGYTIRIHFPEGHGLQPDDVVRFRGIDVGVVDEVELNDRLSGIDVTVRLKPFATPLAREGTRFWIVRPELSLTGISGLETAVGHKYIGLLPGPEEGLRQFSFEGLSEIPPDARAENGFEITIRGDRRQSISSGSPVTCRGVEVGGVLSVGLSRNARFVDVRARIYERFRNFLNSETRFLASSGVDVDFTIGGGLKLEAESLETIARGGVSLLTISDQGTPVNNGQVFKLYPAAEEAWFKAAADVRINDVQLGFAVPLEVRWKQSGLFRVSQQKRSFGGIPVAWGDQVKLLVPNDMLRAPEAALEESFQLYILGSEDPLATSAELANASPAGEDPGLAWLTIDSAAVAETCQLETDFRQSEGVEDCLAVRAAGQPGAYDYLHYAIDKDLLFTDEATGQLRLRFFDGDPAIWHGAPVQSVADGKLIGVLLTDGNLTTIVGTNEIRQQAPLP